MTQVTNLSHSLQLSCHPILRKCLPSLLMKKLRAPGHVPWTAHPTLAQGPHTYMPPPSTERQNNPSLTPCMPSLQYLLHQPDSYSPTQPMHPTGSSLEFKNVRVSLVAQWLRVCLPMQGTWVWALVWEDPTCCGATGPVSHNY